jgi:hypothetical protein
MWLIPAFKCWITNDALVFISLFQLKSSVAQSLLTGFFPTRSRAFSFILMTFKKSSGLLSLEYLLSLQ